MTRAAALALAAVAALAGCGDDGDDGAEPAGAEAPIALTIRYDDGGGNVRTGTLRCTATEQRAGGALGSRATAARQCSHVRDITGPLTTPPPADRACTEIYGGPETVRITGTIGDERVDRRFSRTNGCEIADFTRVAGALPVPG